MALSSETVAGRSWNPLCVAGTALPANILLMAKLIVIALFLTNQVRQLPDPFLPFVPGLDRLVPGAVFQGTLRAVFLVSMVTLFFNRAVRASCLLLGSSILLGVVSSRAYYSNNMTLCALLLILAGLSVSRQGALMLRLQVALVYFGAGLNKALDPDWQSGQFFDHWAIEALHQPVYIWLHGLFPPLALGKLMCWFILASELSASVMMLAPRLYLYGACISIFLQSGFLLLTGETFNMFFFVMQAALLSFLSWPAKPAEVIYDGDCGFCTWCREQFARLDFDRQFDWWPYQSHRGRAYGIADETASRRLQLVTPGGVLVGFHAIRRMLVFTPALWMAIFALTAIARGPFAAIWRRVIVGAALLFFSPLINGLGVAVYDLVVRNRHLIFPSRTCKLPESTERSYRQP